MNAAKLAAMFPSLLRMLPDDQKRIVGFIMQAAAGAHLLGPPDPPAALSRLFEDAAIAHELPPELLAAVAAVLTQYDPTRPDGLLAIPGAPGGPYGATLDQLHERDPEALEKVRRGVGDAAAEIAELRRAQPSGLAGAIYVYVERHRRAAGKTPNILRIRRTAGEVMGAFAIMAARRLPGDRIGKIEGLIDGN